MKRSHWLMVAVVAGLLAAALPAQAQDDVHVVLDKALKAHGGEEKLAQLKAGHFKTKGMLALGMPVEFQQESFFQIPGEVKETLTLEEQGKKITLTTALSGGKGWVAEGEGKPRELNSRILEELKEMVNLIHVTRLAPLKNKAYELTALGEFEVKGAGTLVGMKVATAGFRPVNIYFDKATGLLVKSERPFTDPRTGKEGTEERLYSEFKDVNGIQAPHRVTAYRDGKKFMETEVKEAEFKEKLASDIFARP